MKDIRRLAFLPALLLGSPALAAIPPFATGQAPAIVAGQRDKRGLIPESIPTSNNAAADVVVGQPDMISVSANQGSALSAGVLDGPQMAYVSGGRLFVADSFNNRVLIYNSIPTSNNAAADVVVGQPDMTSGGTAMTARTLNNPYAAVSDGKRLFIADYLSSRVLIYNSIPTSNNAAADVVVGAPDMTTGGGGTAANTLSAPGSVYSDGTRLYVADFYNSRVLIYNSIPTSNNAAADVVVGQPDMTQHVDNQGGSPTANTLFWPGSVYSDGTKLYIADSLNHRVLIYNSIPTSNNAAADIVIGQPDMTSNGPGTTANTLDVPSTVYVDRTRLYVADYSNNRVLVFGLPDATGSIGPSGGSLTFTPTPGAVTVTVPAGALSSPVAMTLSYPLSFPCVAPDRLGALKATGVGMQIDLSPALQPSGSVFLSVGYREADVAGLDQTRLVLARCDASGVWVPLASSPNPAAHAVRAATNHFSIFQLMGLAPASDLSGVNVFPNPLRPARGDTTFTFSNLPAEARVRIYTLRGELVKDLAAGASGLASWDATNQRGNKVASGVYFAFVQGAGASRTIEVAVQR